MFITSVEPKNLYRAKTKHLMGANKCVAHKKVDDVFSALIRFLCNGQRDVSYAELAEVSGQSLNTVRYYVFILVKCEAVKIG